MKAKRKEFKVYYTDSHDPGCPTFTEIIKAYDAADAEDKFYDSEDSDGWSIIKIM